MKQDSALTKKRQITPSSSARSGSPSPNGQRHEDRLQIAGAFDLPETATTTLASPSGLSVRTLTFTGHKLGAAESAGR
jgi:hypothetical protein